MPNVRGRREGSRTWRPALTSAVVRGHGFGSAETTPFSLALLNECTDDVGLKTRDVYAPSNYEMCSYKPRLSFLPTPSIPVRRYKPFWCWAWFVGCGPRVRSTPRNRKHSLRERAVREHTKTTKSDTTGDAVSIRPGRSNQDESSAQYARYRAGCRRDRMVQSTLSMHELLGYLPLADWHPSVMYACRCLPRGNSFSCDSAR
jgi:hypothetical protein